MTDTIHDTSELSDQELLRCAKIATPCYNLYGWKRELEMMRAAIAADRARRHPQPVPVSERLPRPEDCDAEGRCWLLTVEDDYPQWRLHTIEGAQPGGAMIWVPVDSSPGVMVDCFYTSHWLPANALPTPSENV